MLSKDAGALVVALYFAWEGTELDKTASAVQRTLGQRCGVQKAPA